MEKFDRAAAPQGRPRKISGDIALVGTYPPQLCGIATFTEDLRRAFRLADPAAVASVCAIRGRSAPPHHPPGASMVVDRDDPDGYRRAGLAMNARGVDLISLQHEFGIFGGVAGEHVLRLLDAADADVVTTVHTVSSRLDADQRRVLKAVADRSSRIVTMAKKGREILIGDFDLDRRKIEVVPHGVPDAPAKDMAKMKAALGFAGRTVLLTFGLIGRGKGLETMIRAVPAVAARRPDVLYVVLGATHPEVLAAEGEGYRDMLIALAEHLGVERNVAFVNRYATLDELLDYLSAADLYVTPYLKEEQITSGTLSYAYALGTPVVSTPYWHAAELLADGRGALCPFGDSEAFARAATALIADPARRASIKERALAEGARMRWPAVGARYLKIFDDVRCGRHGPDRTPSAAPRLEKGSRHDANVLVSAGAVARSS